MGRCVRGKGRLDWKMQQWKRMQYQRREMKNVCNSLSLPWYDPLWWNDRRVSLMTGAPNVHSLVAIWISHDHGSHRILPSSYPPCCFSHLNKIIEEAICIAQDSRAHIQRIQMLWMLVTFRRCLRVGRMTEESRRTQRVDPLCISVEVREIRKREKVQYSTVWGRVSLSPFPSFHTHRALMVVMV